MIELWIGNSFLIELILDLGNYCLFCLFFIFFYKKKYINQLELLLFCILMLTPFLFNNSFFTWKFIPDQSKYLSLAYTIREELSLRVALEATDFNKLKMIIASYFFAYSPLVNIDTFKSIGFLNRFLILSTTLFFFKKNKIGTSLFLITLLSPSLTFFSSVSLREILIIISMIWSFYFFIEKKYILFLILSSIIILIKYQNILILFISCYFYFILNNENKKIILNLSLIVISIFIIFFGDYFIFSLNEARRGLYYEAYGAYKGISSLNTYQDIKFDLNLFFTSFKSLLMFISSPLFNANSWFKIISLVEILILYTFLFKDFFIVNNTKVKKILLIWIFIFIFSFTFYSLVVFNDGSIHRYRLSLMLFILFGYNLQKYKILDDKK